MEMQQEIRREWHSQPVSVVAHVVTLIVMIAGFGSIIGVMQERQNVQADVTRELRAEQAATFKKDAEQDGKIQVLQSELVGINKKLDQVLTEIRELHKDNRK